MNACRYYFHMQHLFLRIGSKGMPTLPATLPAHRIKQRHSFLIGVLAGFGHGTAPPGVRIRNSLPVFPDGGSTIRKGSSHIFADECLQRFHQNGSILSCPRFIFFQQQLVAWRSTNIRPPWFFTIAAEIYNYKRLLLRCRAAWMTMARLPAPAVAAQPLNLFCVYGSVTWKVDPLPGLL